MAICLKCAEGRDIDGTRSTVRYCRTYCLRTDPDHAVECGARNVRKQLYRAREILQSVFYTWREIAFGRQVHRVQTVGDKIHLSQSFDDDEQQRRGPFHAFPLGLCRDDREKKAVLSWMACNNAPQMVFELSRKLLSDITSSIECVHFLLASGSYKVIDKMHPYDGLNEVLAVDASDGNSYVIDLSGAQIGLKNPIMPLRDYMELFGTRVINLYKHEHVIDTLDAMIKTGFQDPKNDQRYATQYHMYKALNQAVDESEQTMGEAVGKLTQIGESAYDDGKEHLEDRVRLALQKAIAMREQLGHPCISTGFESSDLNMEDRVPTLEDEVGSGIYQQFVREAKGVDAEKLGKALNRASTDSWRFKSIARPVSRPLRLELKRAIHQPRSWIWPLSNIFQR